MTQDQLSKIPAQEWCQCVPGLLQAGDPAASAQVRDALADLATQATDLTPGRPDAAAVSLWFIQAAYVYKQATADTQTWLSVLMPAGKRLIQAIIAGNYPAARMDDGGLLVPAAPGPAGSLMELNALWYNALALLAQELLAAGDRATGDHFERLAGRFRRSFTKAFWCEAHNWLCEPALQKAPDHAEALPDPMQLLVSVLPFSPIPRTRQRQILLAIKDKSWTPLGLRVPGTDLVAPLYLAWLVDGYIKSSENPAKAAAEAKPWLAGVPAGDLPQFFQGDPPQAAGAPVHGPTTFEVQRLRWHP